MFVETTYTLVPNTELRLFWCNTNGRYVLDLGLPTIGVALVHHLHFLSIWLTILSLEYFRFGLAVMSLCFLSIFWLLGCHVPEFLFILVRSPCKNLNSYDNPFWEN